MSMSLKSASHFSLSCSQSGMKRSYLQCTIPPSNHGDNGFCCVFISLCQSVLCICLCPSSPQSSVFSFFLSPPLCLFSIHSLFFSVTNLFLFTSPPVFCSVSLFISVPFKHFFLLWIWQSKPLQGDKNKLWPKNPTKNQTWKKIFNLWNLNWIELN